MVLYGLPKSGKTTAISKLKNCLIVDVEDGAAFTEGMIVAPPKGGPVSKFKWLKELAAEIRKQGHPYDYVAIDTLSQLDTDAEWVGTWNYMNSVQGKKFNREKDEVTPLKPSDPNYESVLSLANGYGYRYTREAILDIFDELKDLGKICTIFVCHVADKMVAKKGSTDEVMIKDLALVGKTRDIIPRVTDAIGNVWNEDGVLKVSFVGDSQKVGGIRAKHLLGYTGTLEWDSIFIKE